MLMSTSCPSLTILTWSLFLVFSPGPSTTLLQNLMLVIPHVAAHQHNKNSTQKQDHSHVCELVSIRIQHGVLQKDERFSSANELVVFGHSEMSLCHHLPHRKEKVVTMGLCPPRSSNRRPSGIEVHQLNLSFWIKDGTKFTVCELWHAMRAAKK